MANRELNVAVAAETTLAASLASAATTMTVDSSTPFPAVDFSVVIDPDVDAKREVVVVTNVSGTTWTVTRGQDGTSDVAHDSGAVVALTAVPALWSDLHDRVEAHTHSGGTDGTAIATGDLTGHTKAAHDALTLDHGSLSGLTDDDHTQYHNNTRHDARDHSGLTGIPVVVSAVKTADETVNSSTTVQNDDHLSITLEANTTYAFDVFLDVDATSVSVGVTFKVGFSIPSGATMRWGTMDDNRSRDDSGTLEQVAGDGAQRSAGSLRGYVTTSATSGALQLQWAQSTSHASDLILKTGSWIRAEKIA